MRGKLLVAAALLLSCSLLTPAAALAGANPKLKDLRVELKGTTPGPNYKVKVKTRLRACASDGPLRITIQEEKTGFDHPPTVVATNERHYTRSHNSACQQSKVSWTLSQKFFGIGKYKVRAFVTDAQGDRSRSLVESFTTTD